jgi:hypothetical protein
VTCLFSPSHFVKDIVAVQYWGGDPAFPHIHFKLLNFNVLPAIEKGTERKYIAVVALLRNRNE